LEDHFFSGCLRFRLAAVVVAAIVAGVVAVVVVGTSFDQADLRLL